MRNSTTYSAMGKSPEDALERLKKRLWLNGEIKPTVIQLADMITSYRSRLKYATPKYQIEAERQLRRFSHLYHLPVSSFTRQFVQSEFDKLNQRGYYVNRRVGEKLIREHRRYKRSSLATTKKHLHAVFELAVIDGYIHGNPCQGIRLPKEVFTPKAIFTDEEIARLCMANQGYAIVPFIILGAFLGLGPGEVSKIEHKHFEGDYLTVPGTKNDGRYRKLPLPITVFNLVKDIGLPWIYHSSNSNRMLKEACIRAGIAKGERTLYSLRHSFATMLGEDGCPHDYIARALGHANRTMTMHYSKVSSDALRPYIEARAMKIYTFFGNYLGTGTF